MRIVIVGAGAAGLSLASHIRENNENYEIIVFTKSENIAYSPCAIPLVLGGKITSFDDIIMHDLTYYIDKNIQIHLSTTVTDIDSHNKTISFKKEQKTDKIRYDKLVIATGQEPIIPEYNIEDMTNIFSLNNLDDGRLIQESLKDKKDVVLISKFSIGIESAYELAHKGHNVTFLEETSSILPLFLDEEISQKLVELNEDMTIETNVNISSIINKGSKKEIQFNDKTITADIIILPASKIPSTSLAKKAGCEIGDSAIKINEYLETSVEDIYAIGDCVEVKSHILGSSTIAPSGTNAVRQAMILANNLTNKKSLSFLPVVNTVVSSVGNYYYASCGITESFANMVGMPVVSEYMEPYQKARYCPDNQKLYIKMISKLDGNIVGCQIISKADISSKIDVVSLLILNNYTCEDLISMEFSYTPSLSMIINPLVQIALKLKKQ